MGSACSVDLLLDLPDALDEIPSSDLGAIAKFHELLGHDRLREFLVEATDAFESKSQPGVLGVLWAKWIGRPQASRRPISPSQFRPRR